MLQDFKVGIFCSKKMHTFSHYNHFFAGEEKKKTSIEGTSTAQFSRSREYFFRQNMMPVLPLKLTLLTKRALFSAYRHHTHKKSLNHAGSTQNGHHS